MRKRSGKNILCLEGNWDGFVLEPKSGMKSLLDFITANQGTYYSYNFINTIEEFKYVLDNTNTRNFSMLYLGFHGKPNSIITGRYKEFEIQIQDLAKMLGKKFSGYGIHFASCAVLDVNDEVLRSFKDETELAFISGYTKNVDFEESSLTDLALINRWMHSKKYGKMFTNMQKTYKSIILENGFRFYN